MDRPTMPAPRMTVFPLLELIVPRQIEERGDDSAMEEGRRKYSCT